MSRTELVALVVDDQVTARRMMHNRLARLGFDRVLESADDDTAWALLQAPDARVDLIVSRGEGGICCGFALLDRIRGDERFALLPFLMVSEHGDRELVRDAIRAGVTHYLVKPFSQETLQRHVESALNQLTRAEGRRVLPPRPSRSSP